MKTIIVVAAFLAMTAPALAVIGPQSKQDCDTNMGMLKVFASERDKGMSREAAKIDFVTQMSKSDPDGLTETTKFFFPIIDFVYAHPNASGDTMTQAWKNNYCPDNATPTP